MIYIYTSPLRPYDCIGISVNLVLSHCDLGPWTPQSRYAFDGPLPERTVSQWSLVLVEQRAA